MNIGGSNRGSVMVAFGMGAVAALLAGACVAPVVIQVVLFSSDLYARGTTIALALPVLSRHRHGDSVAHCRRGHRGAAETGRVDGPRQAGAWRRHPRNGRLLRISDLQSLREPVGRSGGRRVERAGKAQGRLVLRRWPRGSMRQSANRSRSSSTCGRRGARTASSWITRRSRTPTSSAALDGYVKIKFQAEDPDSEPAKIDHAAIRRRRPSRVRDPAPEESLEHFVRLEPSSHFRTAACVVLCARQPMRSRAVRLSCGALALIALGAAAFFVIRSETATRRPAAPTAAPSTFARARVTDALSDLRAAAAGLRRRRPGRRVLDAEGCPDRGERRHVNRDAAQHGHQRRRPLGGRSRPPPRLPTSPRSTRARATICGSGQLLMAGDVIFTEGDQTAATAARQVEAARLAEHQALDASEGAVRRQEAMALAGAGGADGAHRAAARRRRAARRAEEEAPLSIAPIEPSAGRAAVAPADALDGRRRQAARSRRCSRPPLNSAPTSPACET